MKDLIYNYSKIDNEFNNKLNTLKEWYCTSDISEEVIADVCGKLLGSREFIESVVEKKLNMFYKGLNKKYISKECVNFIKDLSKIWLDAYYRNESNLNETKFSIRKDSYGNKYVEIDTDQDIFEGKSLSEQNKIAKKYILDSFRKNGIDVNNENIKVTSKTANEYTHPKRELNKKDMSSKLRASTELDNLLSVSEYKYSRPDDGRHNIAKDGWDYYKVNFKVGNKIFEGLINIAKKDKRKTLYDITHIKKTSLVGLDYMSSTTRAMSFSRNNIPQSKNHVK